MGKNTDRSFLFFFRGICWLVFAYSHVKEASTGIIRTMHTQKKRLREWSKRGGREGNRDGIETGRRWASLEQQRWRKEEVDAAFLLICEITLSLFLSILFHFLFFLSILVFFPCNPSSRLVTLPVPPVSGFAVHWNARVIIPSFFIDLFRDTAVARTDWFSVPLLLPRCTRLFIATIIATDAFPSIDHRNTLPLRGFSRFACFEINLP